MLKKKVAVKLVRKMLRLKTPTCLLFAENTEEMLRNGENEKKKQQILALPHGRLGCFVQINVKSLFTTNRRNITRARAQVRIYGQTDAI